jgi:hypothetical protein
MSYLDGLLTVTLENAGTAIPQHRRLSCPDGSILFTENPTYVNEDGTVGRNEIKSAGGGNIFIYRDSEPSPSGNVFPTFALAYAARIAFAGPAEIWIDDSLNFGGATVHAGTFDFNNTILRGMEQHVTSSPLDQPITLLSIPDESVTFANLRDVRDLAIVNGSTAGPIVGPSPPQFTGAMDQVTLRNAHIYNQYTGNPFWLLSGYTLASFHISLLEGSGLHQAGTNPVFRGVSALGVRLVIDGVSAGNTTLTPSAVDSGCFSDDGTCSLNIYVGGAGSYSKTQAAFTGGVGRFSADGLNLDVGDTSPTLTSIQNRTTVVFGSLTADRTCTLPPVMIGAEITVIDGDDSLPGHNITLVGTVNGNTNYAMAGLGAGASVTVRGTSVGWWIVAKG